MFRRLVIFLLPLFLVACGPQGENFAFDKVNAGAFNQLVRNQYSDLLQKYVSADGATVDYGAWLANAADIAALKEVVQAVAEQDRDALEPKAELAFLINAYNILTLDLILSNYADTIGGSGRPFRGGRSIRNIQNLNWAVWDDLEFIVAGESLSLNELEKVEIVGFNDARIHFAVNCASVGCPPLLNRSFEAATLDQDLDELSRAFVNSNQVQRTIFDLTASQPNVRTSEIMNWYADDFVRDPRFGSVQAFFKKYVDPAIVPDPSVIDTLQIRYFRPYDWALNEVP